MADAMLELDRLEVRYGAVGAVRGLSPQRRKGRARRADRPERRWQVDDAARDHGRRAARQAATCGSPAPRSVAGAPESIARAGVSLVPEGRRIFGDFSVEENLRLGLSARRGDHTGEAFAEVYELFPMLAESRRRPAGALSGGQQQQLAIGRALVAARGCSCSTSRRSGFRRRMVDAVFAALAAIRDRGVTVLLVEQRAQRTVALADRTYVLANGELRMTLTPADADDTDKLIAAYLS